MKKALLLNAINPKIGGCSSKVRRGRQSLPQARALARLLPDRLVVQGCIFGCDPADEKTMCPDCRKKFPAVTFSNGPDAGGGAPDQRNRGQGRRAVSISNMRSRPAKKSSSPAVLAQANRNILYVDEVNLLNDHIVDVLLDAAAMGTNVIEREGVSYCPPVGIYPDRHHEPEEGELRPQLPGPVRALRGDRGDPRCRHPGRSDKTAPEIRGQSRGISF